MQRQPAFAILGDLARANPHQLTLWLKSRDDHAVTRTLVACLALGCGIYGFSIGLWRAPTQGLFVAVKMPALITLTLTVNGLLNGMLAILLESGLSFRQTLKAQLMSFALFGLIVGSLSPIVIGMVLDAPPADSPEASGWYPVFLLTHTAIIAFAGIAANYKLLRLLQAFSKSRRTGWVTLIAWLAGNLFVGAQLSYNLRPFFGNPKLPIQFLRPNPFDGSFYEAVWKLTLGLFPDSPSTPALWCLLIGLILALMVSVRFIVSKLQTPNPHHP